MKYCRHSGLSRPNCSSIACCWSAFRFSLMKAASGVPGISRNMKNRIVVTASRASALCAKRSRINLMAGSAPLQWRSSHDHERHWSAALPAKTSFGRQLFLLAGRVVELAADQAVAAFLQHLLGLGQAGLEAAIDLRVMPV